MGKSMERLGKVLDSRNKSTTKATFNGVKNKIELGTIDGSLALIPDSLGIPIPKGDYMLPITLTGEFLTENQTVSCSEGGTCTHNHRLPKNEFRSIQSGDRVIMAWCGNEPVILSIVVPS